MGILQRKKYEKDGKNQCENKSTIIIQLTQKSISDQISQIRKEREEIEKKLDQFIKLHEKASKNVVEVKEKTEEEQRIYAETIKKIEEQINKNEEIAQRLEERLAKLNEIAEIIKDVSLITEERKRLEEEIKQIENNKKEIENIGDMVTASLKEAGDTYSSSEEKILASKKAIDDIFTEASLAIDTIKIRLETVYNEARTNIESSLEICRTTSQRTTQELNKSIENYNNYISRIEDITPVKSALALLSKKIDEMEKRINKGLCELKFDVLTTKVPLPVIRKEEKEEKKEDKEATQPFIDKIIDKNYNRDHNEEPKKKIDFNKVKRNVLFGLVFGAAITITSVTVNNIDKIIRFVSGQAIALKITTVNVFGGFVDAARYSSKYWEKVARNMIKIAQTKKQEKQVEVRQVQQPTPQAEVQQVSQTQQISSSSSLSLPSLSTAPQDETLKVKKVNKITTKTKKAQNVKDEGSPYEDFYVKFLKIKVAEGDNNEAARIVKIMEAYAKDKEATNTITQIIKRWEAQWKREGWDGSYSSFHQSTILFALRCRGFDVQNRDNVTK